MIVSNETNLRYRTKQALRFHIAQQQNNLATWFWIARTTELCSGGMAMEAAIHRSQKERLATDMLGTMYQHDED